jgi:hypothetical protein
VVERWAKEHSRFLWPRTCNTRITRENSRDRRYNRAMPGNQDGNPGYDFPWS